MSTPRPLFQLFGFLIFISQTFQHGCIHDSLEHEIKVNDLSYSMYSNTEGRLLQQFQNIQILIDYSAFTGVPASLVEYITTVIMPPSTNYLQATLKVPTRKTKLKTGSSNSLCNGELNVPSNYNDPGVDADLVIFILSKNDSSSTYIAAAGSCLTDGATQRPIIGRVTYNIARISATTVQLRRERDIMMTLHEITHILGFSSSLYRFFIDPLTNKPLQNHIYTTTLMGMNTTVLDLEPLTTRLRTYFGCPTLKGLYLENQGGFLTAGSHIERRILYNEYMTGSAITEARVTEFTLALLEGSGWYQVNYEMADPITWGKGKGCAFVEGPCINKSTKQPNFKEFCSPILSKGCSWTRRAGSSCGAFSIQTKSDLPSDIDWWGNQTLSQDNFADNCPVMLPYANLDCEDLRNQNQATLSSEFYGFDSKCFMGTLYPRKGLPAPYPFCFKSTCKQDAQKKYYVQIQIDSNIVNCTEEKEITVSGYGGTLVCPDPADFCQQIMSEGFCRRKCSGRGSCLERKCVCSDGWDGYDCSISNYTDQCSRCANNDPLKTSCFGDTCECNPKNNTCMCLLSLQTGSTCQEAASLSVPPSVTPVASGENVQPINDNQSSDNALIPVLVGSLAGVLSISGIIFFVKYVLRYSKAKARKKLPAPKLRLSNSPANQLTPQSNQNSPDHQEALRGRLSPNPHCNLPIINQNTQRKHGFGLNVKPLENKNKLANVGKTLIKPDEMSPKICLDNKV